MATPKRKAARPSARPSARRSSRKVVLEPVIMPAKNATEKILVAYFDVSSLTDMERASLQFHVHVQHEASDGYDGLQHPDVPPPTFMLRTTRFENGQIVRIDERKESE